jgi:hypothetical protein
VCARTRTMSDGEKFQLKMEKASMSVSRAHTTDCAMCVGYLGTRTDVDECCIVREIINQSITQFSTTGRQTRARERGLFIVACICWDSE